MRVKGGVSEARGSSVRTREGAGWGQPRRGRGGLRVPEDAAALQRPVPSRTSAQSSGSTVSWFPPQDRLPVQGPPGGPLDRRPAGIRLSNGHGAGAAAHSHLQALGTWISVVRSCHGASTRGTPWLRHRGTRCQPHAGLPRAPRHTARAPCRCSHTHVAF